MTPLRHALLALTVAIASLQIAQIMEARPLSGDHVEREATELLRLRRPVRLQVEWPDHSTPLADDA